MIFIQLAFNTTKKFPHSWSRGNMYNFRDATRGCANSRLTPVILHLYGVQVFVDGILLISRNLPPLIFSRFNISAITRQLATLWETPSGIRVFPATRDEEKMKRLRGRRSDRKMTMEKGGYSFICQGADFVNSFCDGRNAKKAIRAFCGEMMRSTKTPTNHE